MKFDSVHKSFFGAIDGAYSEVTEREVKDSQITLAKDESALATNFFGKEHIHTGRVQLNPDAASKTFFSFPTYNPIDLNLTFPKPNKSELRLYLKKESFRPSARSIWFIYLTQDERKLCLGSMTKEEWAEIGKSSKDNSVNNSKPSNSFAIRPAGRHILTVGRDLIQDQYAAIIELVKNAYDADSPDVHITITAPESRDEIKIVVEDHGHGMDRDTVITKWLVPSTDDKLKRRSSPRGRVMQGRKGVGRYATSFLGSDLLLESVTPQGEKTEVYVDWTEFAQADYLDQVPISVVSTKTSDPSGTRLTITGSKNKTEEQEEDNQDYVLNWLSTPDSQAKKGTSKNRPPIAILQKELKKLIPPVDPTLFSEITNDAFSIFVTVNEHVTDAEEQNSVKIEPYPIFELFDYRISGVIENDGENELIFENQRARNTVVETIDIDVGDSTECGRLIFDLRIYDRDKKSLEQLIQRGLKDDQGNYLGINETKRLLNEFNGIGVYRGGFRIRPLGDPDYDWLELNKARIQNPGRKIGSDRVIGYVQIQSEELSKLEEKSARDGLRDNRAYRRLIEIALQVIVEVETRRYLFLRNSGLRKSSGKVERNLEKLFDLGGLKTRVERVLLAAGVDDAIRISVLDSIVEQQTESNEIVEEIRQTFAIYEGQATLGKIINVVLHEGRKPLSFFRSQSDNIKFWLDDYKKNSNQESLEEAISLASKFGIHTKYLSDLFSRIDPLAARKRGRKTRFNLAECINTSFLVFDETLIAHKISKEIQCDVDVEFTGWPVDIQIILTNLIDNSIFWMTEKKTAKKQISIVVYNFESNFLYLDYKDNGPGIEPSLIKNEIIFEPEFSTKPSGTGLGLAIAGESALRNGLELKAYATDEGAYFRLSHKENDIE